MTTDLDYLYWHPSYVEFTKKAIVASAFGLTFYDPKDKLPYAVFRESYQTALAETVDAAINARPVESSPPGLYEPKLFEIGNSEPKELALLKSKETSPPNGESQSRGLSERIRRSLLHVPASIKTSSVICFRGRILGWRSASRFWRWQSVS